MTSQRARATFRAVWGPGILLDFAYIVSLGPEAIPAIDRYLDQQKPYVWVLNRERNKLATVHLDGTRGWRTWTWRNRQLTKYLRRVGETRSWQLPDGSPATPPDRTP